MGSSLHKTCTWFWNSSLNIQILDTASRLYTPSTPRFSAIFHTRPGSTYPTNVLDLSPYKCRPGYISLSHIVLDMKVWHKSSWLWNLPNPLSWLYDNYTHTSTQLLEPYENPPGYTSFTIVLALTSLTHLVPALTSLTHIVLVLRVSHTSSWLCETHTHRPGSTIRVSHTSSWLYKSQL